MCTYQLLEEHLAGGGGVVAELLGLFAQDFGGNALQCRLVWPTVDGGRCLGGGQLGRGRQGLVLHGHGLLRGGGHYFLAAASHGSWIGVVEGCVCVVVGCGGWVCARWVVGHAADGRRAGDPGGVDGRRLVTWPPKRPGETQRGQVNHGPMPRGRQAEGSARGG